MQFDEKYHIPVFARAAGIAILDSRNRLLLVKEKKPAKAGLWHIPSGSVEPDETLEDAAKRETKEETGLTISSFNYLNTYIGKFDDGEFVARHVWCTTFDTNTDIEPVFKDEISECKFISKNEFDRLYTEKKIRMYHTKLIFEDAITFKKHKSNTHKEI